MKENLYKRYFVCFRWWI